MSQRSERDGIDEASEGQAAAESPGRTEAVESGTDAYQERVREVVGRRGYDENDDLADENEEH